MLGVPRETLCTLWLNGFQDASGSLSRLRAA